MKQQTHDEHKINQGYCLHCGKSFKQIQEEEDAWLEGEQNGLIVGKEQGRISAFNDVERIIKKWAKEDNTWIDELLQKIASLKEKK